MGCGLMNCIRNDPDPAFIRSSTQRIGTVTEFKLTEGILVKQSKGAPEEYYENIRTLGEGSFGLVYLGKHKISGVDGVTNYSNVVSADLEGNVYTKPAPQVNPDGISSVTAKQVTGIEIYDVQGRKLSAAQQGVNIVKMVAADGSSKSVKMYKK